EKLSDLGQGRRAPTGRRDRDQYTEAEIGDAAPGRVAPAALWVAGIAGRSGSPAARLQQGAAMPDHGAAAVTLAEPPAPAVVGVTLHQLQHDQMPDLLAGEIDPVAVQHPARGTTER